MAWSNFTLRLTCSLTEEWSRLGLWTGEWLPLSLSLSPSSLLISEDLTLFSSLLNLFGRMHRAPSYRITSIINWRWRRWINSRRRIQRMTCPSLQKGVMDDILIGDSGLSVTAEPAAAALKANGDSSNGGTNLSDSLNALPWLIGRASNLAYLEGSLYGLPPDHPHTRTTATYLSALDRALVGCSKKVC